MLRENAPFCLSYPIPTCKFRMLQSPFWKNTSKHFLNTSFIFGKDCQHTVDVGLCLLFDRCCWTHQTQSSWSEVEHAWVCKFKEQSHGESCVVWIIGLQQTNGRESICCYLCSKRESYIAIVSYVNFVLCHGKLDWHKIWCILRPKFEAPSIYARADRTGLIIVPIRLYLALQRVLHSRAMEGYPLYRAPGTRWHSLNPRYLHTHLN